MDCGRDGITPTPARCRWERENALIPGPAPVLREWGDQRAALGRPDAMTVGSFFCSVRSSPPAGLCITHMSRCVRPGCKRSPWRRLLACVQAFSPPPAGAGRGRWFVGTNLVQLNIYAQGSHACLTDSMIGTSTFSTPVTRMGNSMPRAGW